MMQDMEDRELDGLLSSFSCTQDQDIEGFLHNRAVDFERLSKSRTYLVFNEDELENVKGTNVTIYGYFTLALKVLKVPKKLSNRARKEIDGYNAKNHGKEINEFPCYLIGQLARNSIISADVFQGKELISMAHDFLEKAVKIVGGRYVMIECKNNQKLKDFYKANGYREIDSIPDDENASMVQMIRPVYEK